MPLRTAADLAHLKRVAQGVDFDPGRGDTTTIAARDPRQKTGRYITSKEQHEARLLEKAREEAARDAAEGPTWAEQMELRRRNSYADWLEIAVEVNAKVAVSRTEIAKLDEELSNALVALKRGGRIQDTGPYADRIPQPLERDEIMRLAKEMPHFEAAVPLLKTAIKHHEEVVDQSMERLRAPWNGLLSKIHADLKQRVDEWRALRIEQLRSAIRVNVLSKLNDGTDPKILGELVEDSLKKSPEYAAIQSAIVLPDCGYVDVPEWQNAINQVEALEALEAIDEAGSTKSETPVGVANTKVPEDVNRTKAATRSKVTHLVSR